MPFFDCTRQIRLIVLDPGTKAASISFSFQFANIYTEDSSQHTSWEAISYRWAEDPGQLHNVHVGNETWQIDDNIFRMLNDLRLADQERRLWIDALCINQGDEREKAEQVQLMRNVYEQARQVIIWLGCKDQQVEAAAVISAARWAEQKCGLAYTLPTDRPLWQVFIAENPDIPWNGPFHEILQNPWFTRMWVVQEAVLARNLVVLMHDCVILWDAFASAALRFMSIIPASEAIVSDLVDCYAACRTRHFSDMTMEGLDMIDLILNLRGWMQSANASVPPSELVLLCGGRQALDGRDMIYGIRGLFGVQRGNLAYPVDYTLAIDELYKRFACWCIQREGNLDILAQQRNERGQNRRAGLSSWATDWSRGRLDNFWTTPTLPVLCKLSSANLAHPERLPVFRRESDTLVVRGFIFDELGGPFSLGDDEASKDRHLRSWLSLIPQDTAANAMLFGDNHPTISTLEQLYHHTYERDRITSHLWRDGHQASQQVRRTKMEWRRPFVTRWGCLAITFPFFDTVPYDNGDPPPKICYLIGGRSLFVLAPAYASTGAGLQQYKLGCGDCFISGFEDGKGESMCRALGLQEVDIYLV
ncbi:hypothetical protein LTR17_008081 [Elasticomyces elasticus]|nr:hypothetical protein LTR17_008081 [Elasticomyces elasticus]